MGWFDWYLPAEDLSCPICGQQLSEWQGSDGPSALLVWQQFSPHPIDQRIDPELRLSPWPQEHWRLPDTFCIQSHDCSCPFPVQAIGNTVFGTWNSTELVTLANAQQHQHETREQWAARRRWLAGKS